MKLDLHKLPEELKIGKLIVENDKVFQGYTPLCRFSYMRVVSAESYQGGVPRFTASAIFNAKNPNEPGHVDLTKIFLPGLDRLAKANKLSLRAQGVSPLSLGQKFNSSGEPVDGYDEWSAYCSFAKYPKGDTDRVECYNANGKLMDPKDVLSGWYGRFEFKAYKPKKFSKIALALVSLQVLAEGETFAGEASTGFGDSGFDAPSTSPATQSDSEDGYGDFGAYQE